MEALDKFSNHLCDQDKFRILISQTELSLACLKATSNQWCLVNIVSHFRDLLKPPETSLQLFAYTTYVYCKESQNNVALSPWRQENFHWLQCVSFAILCRSPWDCGVERNFPLKRFTVSENATWLQINTKCVLGAKICLGGRGEREEGGTGI